MPNRNAPENTEVVILAAKRLSVDKEIVSALENGAVEELKKYLSKSGDFSNISVALGYAKDAETVGFVLQNGKNVYPPDAWAGLVNRYSVALNEADKKEAVHKKYLAMAKALMQNGVEPRFADVLSPFNALQRAAKAKLTRLAVYLIEECGADVNAVPYNTLTLEQRIEHYTTINRICSFCGEEEELPSDEILQGETWESPLLYACQNKDAVLCKCLVEHGADVNYVRRWNDQQGEWHETTPLKEAGKSKRILEILKGK